MSMVIILVLVLAVVGLIVLVARGRSSRGAAELADARSEARRWTERLGGQVLNLTGTDLASQQALADAAERYTAAGSQLDQARTVRQAQLAGKTALEGLYYVRAARTAMGLDPGPDLPADPDAARAGAVEENRSIAVDGHEYAASPEPGADTPHYYPGGRIAGRSVPQGWYSEPWWRSALVAGAWGVGSFLVFDALFSGMSGIGSAGAWENGYDAGLAADGGFDGGGFDGGGQDVGADLGGGWGGGDGDWGGFDF
jgi:hypothetical protein